MARPVMWLPNDFGSNGCTLFIGLSPESSVTARRGQRALALRGRKESESYEQESCHCGDRPGLFGCRHILKPRVGVREWNLGGLPRPAGRVQDVGSRTDQRRWLE